ncbi:glycolate oxidase subunit GlcE [Pseudohoeflea suaedae]|uniref:Glycolate oxidase subunit GlcE n=1 Tax=Pseudohoeflea suaedae TaxID=877384 RepID=A0A4V3A7F1_9HYPH|nr:glycolate oxidase subunit GlcE [Pseudohoeflea suaedae]TDH38465.1 glycolate oxidase subunit GlcE [Pseudohoeflea suaedae]
MRTHPLTPASEEEIAAVVADAASTATPLEILGGGTRRGMGRPVQAATTLDLSRHAGITAYNPAELVMSAKAGTPLRLIEDELDRNGQMLTFEPMDHRPVLGSDGEPTIGGVFAANVSGPRRLTAGAARDSLLGVRFVNGRGEIIKSGGRVMKNVTGLDLVKLMAGSWGTLGVLSEVTFKVLPKPETTATLVVSGLNDAEAAAAMAAAMALPVEVSSAAHLPVSVVNRFLGGKLDWEPVTLLRLEGLSQSVLVRKDKLATAMAAFGDSRLLNAQESAAIWREVRDVMPFAEHRAKPLWRVSVAPSAGHQLVAALRLNTGVDAFYDWQGGLVWLQMEQDVEDEMIRTFIARLGGGHATLVRAAEPVRASVQVFENEPAALGALSARIRQAIDPAGIFNPGRMAPAA